MKRIYLTRHGQTEWNVARRMQGWLDSNLTERGRENARALGVRLKDVDLDVVYCSPSVRTQQTAALICEGRDIDIILDENLREISMGSWEGRNISDIEEEYPEAFNHFWNAAHLYEPVDKGERFTSVQKRTIITIDKILKSDYNNVLLVSHAITGKLIMSYFEGRSPDRFWEEPFIRDTSLSIVEIDDQGKAEILLYADVSHIQEEE